MENVREVNGIKVFKYHKKEYELVDELVKGGCQGCAFINRMDCANLGKTQYCTKLHKIFKLHLKCIDE